MSYARGGQAARGTNAGDPLITRPLFPVGSQSSNLVADPSQRKEPVDSSSASIERATANFEDPTSGTANRSSVYLQQTSFGVSSCAVWKTSPSKERQCITRLFTSQPANRTNRLPSHLSTADSQRINLLESFQISILWESKLKGDTLALNRPISPRKPSNTQPPFDIMRGDDFALRKWGPT